MSPARVLRASALASLLALAACSNAPDDHQVNKDGVRHKAGLTDPLANCTGCHGANLEGGDGPSCTSCHGVKW
jgi:hypothetical protein